ncbi:MAG TPA: hypothetical protein DD733_07655 [Clostridiales bacterium]|nr:hypothetical protein [Clostridiales bacterium]
MLILNQPKTAIYNMDTAANVNTYESIETPGKYIVGICSADSGISDKIGEYETEERAKAVLKEIYDTYCTYEYEKDGTIIRDTSLPKHYEMPAE